ncbi:MAG: hypothetical protein ACLVJH_01985 [Faecalibacterium prausnitzii]
MLTDYLDLLHDWRERYKPASPEEPLDERFVEALHMTETIEHLTDCVAFGTPQQKGRCRRTAAVRVVPADAGGAHRPPCSGKVRLIIYSPEVVGLTVRPATSLF